MTNLSVVVESKTTQQVRDLIDKLKQEVGRRLLWKDVGDRENNLATINMGTDPAGALTERITNAIDAVLDYEWYARGQPPKISSPRQAVEAWFNIKNGQLANVESLRAKEFTKLRDRIIVSLHDSGNKERPTIDIRDRGVGLRAEDLSDTILSLNQSRKLRKFHLAGAFGQGGSTAFAYSEYTLIASRATNVTGGGEHPVAFTIVRFNEGDIETDKHGTYEYLCDPRTGQPFIMEASEHDFPHGTLVRHVGMNVGKYNSTMTAPSNGLYYLGNHYLFDPLLPFLVEEQRSDRKQDRRTVAGNNRRLTTSDIREYHRGSEQTFRDGKVKIEWWVISAGGKDTKKPRNRIKNYTLASKPIIVTYNGQKQGEFPNTVIKKDLKLPYLERFLIIHVDCDDIDNATRRELFPTTRESLRDTGVREDLRDLIVDTLSEDENLRRLDRDRKKRYLQRTDSDSVGRIRKRLADRIQSRLKSDGTGAGVGTGNKRDSTPDPRPEPEPIPVAEPPTFIEITSREPREVYPGKRFTISFRTDANPDYFTDVRSFVPIVTPPSIAQDTGRTSVRNGHGKAHFIASENASVGAEGNVVLEVRPSRSASLKDSITIQVADDEGGSGRSSGASQVPNITPHWVQKGDQFWKDEAWDETSVAKVVSDDESTEVYVSADNRNLNSHIERAQRKGSGTVDAIKDFYMEHVAYHAVVAHMDLTTLSAPDNEEVDIDPGTLEQEQEKELKRVSQTICGIMDDFFTVIAQSEFESDGTVEVGTDSGGAKSNAKD